MPPSTPTRLSLLVAAMAVIAAACSSTTSADPVTTAGNPPAATRQAEGPAAPTTSFTLFDGTEASLADFDGQPIVVNFWASWCPSCVAEMSSAFRPAQQAYEDQVAFIGMNISDDRALAVGLLEETGVEWINAEDPVGDLYAELGGLAMPFTVLINARGTVVEAHNGPLTEEQLTGLIAGSLLG